MQLPQVPLTGEGGIKVGFETLAKATDRAMWPEIDQAVEAFAELPNLEVMQRALVGNPSRVAFMVARGPKHYELGVWYGDGGHFPLAMYHIRAQDLDSGPYSCKAVGPAVDPNYTEVRTGTYTIY